MGKQNWKAGNMLYPVPAVMVSCKREGEKPNIITVAWAGTICSDPAMVSISVRRERYSYDIIKESKEFVINLVTRDLLRATDYCGVKSGRDTDKFKDMKLTPLASQHVSAPGISESPVNIECKVSKIVHLGSHDMITAHVVGVTVDDAYMNNRGKFELNSAGLITYSHGEYFELGKKLGTFGYSVKKSGSSGQKATNRVIKKKSTKPGTKAGERSRSDASGKPKNSDSRNSGRSGSRGSSSSKSGNSFASTFAGKKR